MLADQSWTGYRNSYSVPMVLLCTICTEYEYKQSISQKDHDQLVEGCWSRTRFRALYNGIYFQSLKHVKYGIWTIGLVPNTNLGCRTWLRPQAFMVIYVSYII